MLGGRSVFTDEELESLRRFPEIGREELFRFFTLTPADSAFIDPGRGRGPADRLGLAVAVCTLPWLGFVPDDVASAPPGTGGPDTRPTSGSRTRVLTEDGWRGVVPAWPAPVSGALAQAPEIARRRAASVRMKRQ